MKNNLIRILIALILLIQNEETRGWTKVIPDPCYAINHQAYVQFSYAARAGWFYNNYYCASANYMSHCPPYSPWSDDFGRWLDYFDVRYGKLQITGPCGFATDTDIWYDPPVVSNAYGCFVTMTTASNKECWVEVMFLSEKGFCNGNYSNYYSVYMGTALVPPGQTLSVSIMDQTHFSN